MSEDFLSTPPRPTDPREAAIWDDVFGQGETDLGYFLRRYRELRDCGPVTNVAKMPSDQGAEP